jgi:hypothetical protein
MKSSGKSLLVALNCLGQNTGFNPVKSGELRIEQDLMTADDGNRAGNVIHLQVGWKLFLGHSG